MISTADRLADRYVVGDLLGRGGMGAVHRAVDERLDREVAIKVLPRADGALRDRLQHEARILARLDHPALVRILDADEDDGWPFIVMDLVEGETLAARLGGGPLDEPTVRSLVRQVAGGLVQAHAEGVIHRDLKPANLLLEDDGRVRVVDFGIARLTDATGLTKPGTAVGTAAYLAPEQLQGDGTIGPPADIYTLGLVGLECFTGSRPFHGDAVETALARLEQAPEIPEGLPAPWPRLLRSMTALDPADRPTAEEVAAELEDLQPVAEDATVLQTAAVGVEAPTQRIAEEPSGPTTDSTIVPPAEPTNDPSDDPPPAPPAGPTSGRPVRARRWHGLLADPRRRRIAIGIAVAAVLVVVVLGIVLTRGGDEEAPRSELGPDVPADVVRSLEQLRAVVAP